MQIFQQVLDARIVKIKSTLDLKAGEYATETNRYHNFDVAARIADSTPEQALSGMMLKHLVAVHDLISWTYWDDTKITQTLVDEKIGDLINYLILLEGLFSRRIEGESHDSRWTAGRVDHEK